MHEVVIIGGGINGLMAAYNLLLHGVKDVVIIERNYVGSGSTFRCATGIRASFTTKEHIALMKRSIELWEKLSKELSFKYVRGGYIWLLTKPRDIALFKNIVKFQNELGVPTRFIDIDDLKNLVPYINDKGVVSAVYDPLAGKASCFEVTLKLYEILRKGGVKIFEGVKANKISIDVNKSLRIITSRGTIYASRVVIAAGYGSKELLESLGIKAPFRNITKHALITEALSRLFDALIIDWASSSYIVQTLHGGLIMGTDIGEETDDLSCNVRFLFKVLSVWSRYFTWIKNISVLRCWTGYYVVTPDHHPVLGPLKKCENVYIASGFSGHGFMLAPVVGELVSEWVMGRRPSIPEVNRLSLERFERGEVIKEFIVFG